MITPIQKLADDIELELSRMAYMQDNRTIRILRTHIASAVFKALEKNAHTQKQADQE